MDKASPIDKIIQSLGHAVAMSNEKELQEALYELGTHAMQLGEYSDAIVAHLVGMLQSDKARMNGPSWLIWKHFEENYSLLTEQARTRLRRASEEEFDRSEDWMWSFTIGVLLAECFADEEALDALARFRKGSSVLARRLLPDAIRNLARHTNDPELRLRARRELSRLERDPASEVRQEAADAVARWK